MQDVVGRKIMIGVVVVWFGVLAFGFMGCGSQFVLVLDAQRVERPMMKLTAPTEEPPLFVAEQDRALLSRLLPHMRRTAQEQIDVELRKVADELEGTDPVRGHPVGGFGSTLAAAIVYIVKKIVQAIIMAIIMSVLVALFVAYWKYPAIFMICWVAMTGLIAKFVAKHEVAKSKP